MPYRILADLVVLVHFLWILFLIFGAIWGRRKRHIRLLHISGLVFAFIIEIFDIYCPLTHVEVWLRARHEPASYYTGAFIVYYMERFIYIELPRNLIAVSTTLLCGLNAWLYLRQKPSKLDK